jgi:hypothetical protein
LAACKKGKKIKNILNRKELVFKALFLREYGEMVYAVDLKSADF